jgi:Glycosyl transferase family 2
MSPKFSLSRYVLAAGRMAFDALKERRLSTSPRRWLLDLRHLHGVMTEEPHGALPVAPTPVNVFARRKEVIADLYRSELQAFLASRSRLRFESAGAPHVSVLLVAFNRAELTLRCLRALLEEHSIPVELIVVDNNSSDDTSTLLDRLDGARIIRSKENVGFLRGCNAAAAVARGDYLLFLNNDAELLPGSLVAGVRTLERSPSIGAAGGRLIFSKRHDAGSGQHRVERRFLRRIRPRGFANSFRMNSGSSLHVQRQQACQRDHLDTVLRFRLTASANQFGSRSASQVGVFRDISHRGSHKSAGCVAPRR